MYGLRSPELFSIPLRASRFGTPAERRAKHARVHQERWVISRPFIRHPVDPGATWGLLIVGEEADPCLQCAVRSKLLSRIDRRLEASLTDCLDQV